MSTPKQAAGTTVESPRQVFEALLDGYILTARDAAGGTDAQDASERAEWLERFDVAAYRASARRVDVRDDNDAAEVQLRREHAQTLKSYIYAVNGRQSRDVLAACRAAVVATRDELAFYLDVKAEAAKLAGTHE
jgi:hypothetical protein